MKYLYILLVSASVEGYYTIKIDRDYNLTCFDQADEWIEQNSTHTWQDQQGYYLNRSDKKELVFGAYCDNK